MGLLRGGVLGDRGIMVNSQTDICPRCQKAFVDTTAPGPGVCPACGGEILNRERSGPASASLTLGFKNSGLMFLTVLIAPVGALLGMASLIQLGFPKATAQFVIGMPAYLFSFVSAGYCSWWLAKRVAAGGGVQALLTVLFVLSLIIVYSFVVVGGCVFILDKL